MHTVVVAAEHSRLVPPAVGLAAVAVAVVVAVVLIVVLRSRDRSRCYTKAASALLDVSSTALSDTGAGTRRVLEEKIAVAFAALSDVPVSEEVREARQALGELNAATVKQHGSPVQVVAAAKRVHDNAQRVARNAA